MARKVVRSPFVVTVAVMAGAALPGCGAQFNPAPTESTADSGTTDGRTTDAENPPLTKTCPAERPAPGDTCRVDSAVYCNYGTCSPGSYPVTLQCDPIGRAADGTSTWREAGGSSCNPPPPECPTVPFEGAPCKAGWGSCSYPDTCDQRPPDAPAYRSWSCVGDKLVSYDTTTDYVVKCPVVAPKNGDPCSCAGHYAGPCSYGDCGGTPTTTATCDAKTQTWSVSVLSCNPPPPDAGF